ncbi:MAG: glycosyltransferase family protein, partial [Alphaproteobacteria bacterium]
MADTGRVFIWVQHLFGIGPLLRAAHIARYLASRGWDVDLVSGGPPVRGLDVGGARLHQLPPVRVADATYSRLVYVDGKPLDDSLKALRRDLLLRLFAGADPHILMFEHFPFGRARFRFELGPLLIAAAQSTTRPAIIASVREILSERSPEEEARNVAMVDEVFDSVLVHGDPRLIGLEASFGAVPRIAEKLAYTGYVGGTSAAIKLKPGIGTNEIIVSTGSGAFGAKLASIAVDAAKTMQYVRRWRILLDSAAGPRAFRKLSAQAPEWATVEAARPDLRTLLARCAVSVSQAGYN